MKHEPLRVLFLLPGYAPHPIGGYKIVYEYANALVERGHDVSIAQSWNFAFAPHDKKFSIRTLKNLRHGLSALRNRRPNWFKLDSRIHLTNHFKLTERKLPMPDVVVATAAQSAPLAAKIAQTSKGGGIYFIQHNEVWAADAGFVKSTWELPLRRVVIAPWLQDIGNRFNMPSTVVVNSIDMDRFPLGKSIGERPLRIAAMVSPVVWKRTDLIASVFVLVKAAVPGVQAITFGVCNRPAALPDYVEHLKLPSESEIPLIYQNARVFLCTSDYEGWHLPSNEAIVSGCTLVSTDIGGTRAYASDFARFAPVGDAVALATEVIALLKDPDECTRLSEAGSTSLRSYSRADAIDAFERELAAAVCTERPHGL